MMTSLGGGQWQCLTCGYQSKSTNVKYHIEAKHVESSGYNCALCGDFFKARSSLNQHMSVKHRKARINWWHILQALFLLGFADLMTNLGHGKWECLTCGYQSKSTNVKYHIESKHFESSGYHCSECGDFLKTRQSEQAFEPLSQQ